MINKREIRQIMNHENVKLESFHINSGKSMESKYQTGSNRPLEIANVDYCYIPAYSSVFEKVALSKAKSFVIWMLNDTNNWTR